MTKEEIRKERIKGAEEFFHMIDKEYHSFVIDEEFGKLLSKYREAMLNNRTF